MIQTRARVRRGGPVQLEVSFPRLLSPVRLHGTVRWVRDGDGGTREAGIAFSDIRGAEQLLDTLIAPRRPTATPAVTETPAYRVLVAEDNLQVAQLIRRALETSAIGDDGVFQFAHAQDGQHVGTRLAREHFDLLIVDVHMRGIDGLSLIERIRSDARLGRLPMIAISLEEGEHQGALAAGADFFMRKPVRLADLLQTIRRLLVCGGARVPLPLA